MAFKPPVCLEDSVILREDVYNSDLAGFELVLLAHRANFGNKFVIPLEPHGLSVGL